MIQLCRLSGCATIGCVMRMGLSGPSPPQLPGSIVLLAGVFILAVLVGNIAKEIAVACCGHLSNWLGRSFRRTGLTLGGTVFRELRRADGTWRRYEMRPTSIVCEWTNRRGECHKRVFRRVPDR